MVSVGADCDREGTENASVLVSSQSTGFEVCDYPTQRVEKVAYWTKVGSTQPPIRYLLQRMSLGAAGLERALNIAQRIEREVVAAFNKSSISDLDANVRSDAYERAACEWIQDPQNHALWREWVLPTEERQNFWPWWTMVGLSILLAFTVVWFFLVEPNCFRCGECGDAAGKEPLGSCAASTPLLPTAPSPLRARAFPSSPPPRPSPPWPLPR